MPILTYTEVTKSFGPDVVVLDSVSFAVEPGELVLLTGQTGSGKTTLMKLLTREYPLTSGEIYFNDIPVHTLTSGKVHSLRRELGVVFQDYRLIKDLNVWENVATPLFITGKNDTEIEQRTSDLLNLIGLTDKAEAFPSQLSGGEAQRVAIARALALGPELVFADEPTGNLDAETSKGIAQLLAKINELGTTILIATHDATLLDIFATRRRLELAKGRLTADTKSAVTHGTTSSKPEAPVQTDSPKVAPTAQDSDEEDTPPIDPTTTMAETHSSETPDAVPTDNTTDAAVASDPSADPPEKKSFWHRLRLSKKSKKAVKPEMLPDTDDAKPHNTEPPKKKSAKHSSPEKSPEKSKEKDKKLGKKPEKTD